MSKLLKEASLDYQKMLPVIHLRTSLNIIEEKTQFVISKLNTLGEYESDRDKANGVDSLR